MVPVVCCARKDRRVEAREKVRVVSLLNDLCDCLELVLVDERRASKDNVEPREQKRHDPEHDHKEQRAVAEQNARNPALQAPLEERVHGLRSHDVDERVAAVEHSHLEQSCRRELYCVAPDAIRLCPRLRMHRRAVHRRHAHGPQGDKNKKGGLDGEKLDDFVALAHGRIARGDSDDERDDGCHDPRLDLDVDKLEEHLLVCADEVRSDIETRELFIRHRDP
eukprot:Amastigsp_a2346_16.p2 type:complete len:222 gc:universal Amastigsp_a2346_16:250-915(+)